jgi:glutathione peroxidase
MSSSSLYDIEVERLAGGSATLGEYAGKVLLIVNTASQCGLTPHYAGLEKLHQAYKDRGLVVLGFPCNQFGAQEPGSAEEIGAFCEKNYGVSFPMFAKIEVNGDGAHPLYRYLKQHARGILGTEAIKWNFTKFLVSRDGQHIERYAPTTTPEDLVKDIEAML